MTADRLDLDALEAYVGQESKPSAIGELESLVAVTAEDMFTLIAAAREAERLTRWQAEAMTVLGEWREAWNAAGKPGLLGASMASGMLAEVTKVRSERDAAQAALARVTDEAMVERIERSIQNAYVTSAALGNVPWLDHRQAAVNVLSAILATATEGQEAGGK